MHIWLVVLLAALPSFAETSKVFWRTEAQLDLLAVSAPSDGRPLRFTVIGDAEPGRFFRSRWLFNDRGVFQKVLSRAREEESDFIIQLGDMVSRGSPRRYERFLGQLGQSRLDRPYLTVIGNHDRSWPHGEADADLYQEIFGPLDYFFDAGDRRFVAFDTSLVKATPAQLDWLDRALDAPRRGVVFCHIPPHQLRPWTFGGGGFKEGSERFLEILSRRKVERVYVGHVHGFGTLERQGVRFVLSGGGGSPLYPSGAPRKMHHYLSVEVRPEGLRETVHPLDSEPFPILWPHAVASAR